MKGKKKEAIDELLETEGSHSAINNASLSVIIKTVDCTVLER